MRVTVMITIFLNFEPTCSLRGYPGAVRLVLPVPVHSQVFMCWVFCFPHRQRFILIRVSLHVFTERIMRHLCRLSKG